MNHKNVRKEHLAGLVILVAVVTTVALVWSALPKTKQLVITPEIQECAEGKRAVSGGAPGRIIVRFEKGITENEATDLITSYGLGISDSIHLTSGNFSIFSVIVPDGTEYEWMCELERSDIVTSSNPVIMGGIG